jgi:Protein of unknown function (DUF3011)
MRTRFILFFCFVFAALLAPIATPAQQNITCESNDGGRKHCGPANPGQVTLQRQISGTECIQDRSWGVDDRGLWVDHGCRADFQIGGGGNYDNGAGGGPGGQSAGATIKCESNDGNRKYCGQVDSRSQVTIQQQISGTPCEQGRSWGVDNRGLWVDRGCRAVFATGGGYDDGGNDRDHERGPGFGPALTDYPRVRADSSGHGTFSGGNYGSNNVTRGWFDTREGRPTVSLSGSHDFKVTFFGDITRVDDRHLTMRITESSQGRARGRAEIFLNHDRNEIESISISGRDFNGDFSRR